MKICYSIFASLASLTLVTSTFASLPDNGSGTIDMPPQAPYVGAPGELMYIIDGLPAGSTIELTTVFTAPTATVEQNGGSFMGGTQSAGEGNGFQWQMQGTGAYSGYSRNLFLSMDDGSVASFPPNPLTTPGYEVHADARVGFSPVQSFDTDMFRMFGQITNPADSDPDFDLLRIVAGTDFGLPSPGHTTLLTDGMGGWDIYSVFDLTYRIDFVGAPGGPFGGRSGSTTGTIRIVLPEPASLSVLAGMGLIALRRRARI